MKPQKIFKHFAGASLAIVMTVSATPLPAMAAPEAAIDFNSLTSLGEYVDTELGPQYILYDQTLLQPDTGKARQANDLLPETYDLRDLGLVTSVKDQGITGACWSFSSIASLESNMLKKGISPLDTLDLSERHLAWYTFKGINDEPDKSRYAGKDVYSSLKTWDDLYQTDTDYYDALGKFLDRNGIDKDEFALYCSGGNNFFAAATLARTYGVVDETELPYITLPGADNSSIAGAMGAPGAEDAGQTDSNIYLKASNILPATQIDGNYMPTGTEAIKKALIEDGIVSILYYGDQPDYSTGTDGTYFNYANWAQYVNDDDVGLTHAVSIVGWDDNYSVSNFNSDRQPPDNGAWIVKNSWGSTEGADSWGIDGSGYFYLSYYDKSINTAATFVAEDIVYNASSSSHTYDNIYQYDGVGFGDDVIEYPSPVSAANVFHTRNNAENTAELLSAVGLFTGIADVTAEISVYTGWEGNDITSGTKLTSMTAQISNAGYHTIELDSPVFLPDNSDYAVVVCENSVVDDAPYYLMPFEIEFLDDTSKVDLDIQEGQTFVNTTGTWTDMKESGIDPQGTYLLGNALVKAYTVNQTAPVIQDTTAGSKLTYGQALSDSAITGTAAIDGQIISGQFSWKEPSIVPTAPGGEYDVIFTPDDTQTYPVTSGKASVEVAKKGITVTANNAETVYGSPTPAFDFTVPDNALVGTDTKEDLKVVLTTGADINSLSGIYTITGTSQADNYTVTVLDGSFTISPRAVTNIQNQSSLPDDLVNKIVVTGNILSADSKEPYLIITDSSYDFSGALQKTDSIISQLNITLADGTYTDKLIVTLPVKDEVSEIKVLHGLIKDEKDSNNESASKDKIDTYARIAVNNQTARAEVYSLSSFAVVRTDKAADTKTTGTASVSKAADKLSMKAAAKTVKTGDTNNVWIYIGIIAAAAIIIIALLIYKKKKR